MKLLTPKISDLFGGLDITDLKNFDTGIENDLCE